MSVTVSTIDDLGIVVPSANFTRPADTNPYAQGDTVANSTTAGSVAPMSWTVARVAAGSFSLRRARLKKSTTSLSLGLFWLHLYSSSPTSAAGDNAAYNTPHSGYLGTIEFDMPNYGKSFSDASAVNGAPRVGAEINVKLASGQVIYGLLEARAAYVPGSAEAFTVELEVLQN